jgi:hypothetical protein
MMTDLKASAAMSMADPRCGDVLPAHQVYDMAFCDLRIEA